MCGIYIQSWVIYIYYHCQNAAHCCLLSKVETVIVGLWHCVCCICKQSYFYLTSWWGWEIGTCVPLLHVGLQELKDVEKGPFGRAAPPGTATFLISELPPYFCVGVSEVRPPITAKFPCAWISDYLYTENKLWVFLGVLLTAEYTGLSKLYRYRYTLYLSI